MFSAIERYHDESFYLVDRWRTARVFLMNSGMTHQKSKCSAAWNYCWEDRRTTLWWLKNPKQSHQHKTTEYWERLRWFMNNWKRVGDGTELCGISLLLGSGEEKWPVTIVATARNEPETKIQRRIESVTGYFGTEVLCQTPSKALQMSTAIGIFSSNPLWPWFD